MLIFDPKKKKRRLFFENVNVNAIVSTPIAIKR
jgi:hypothetical protein